MVAPFITLVRAGESFSTTASKHTEFLNQKPEETLSVLVIVGAVFGSTSISDQPHDLRATDSTRQKQTLPPKKKSNRESKRTICIGYSLHGPKSEPKKLPTARPHARCYWHDYPSGIPQEIFVYLCELST